MPTRRQRIQKLQLRTADPLIVQTGITATDLTLASRDPGTGNWNARISNGSTIQVKQVGAFSASGFTIPGITTRKGLGVIGI